MFLTRVVSELYISYAHWADKGLYYMVVILLVLSNSDCTQPVVRSWKIGPACLMCSYQL